MIPNSTIVSKQRWSQESCVVVIRVGRGKVSRNRRCTGTHATSLFVYITNARHFMHNASHPFRLVGQLSRNAYNYWKNVSSNRSFVRRVQSALFWLPTATVLTQVGCTIRAVTGNSMEVRIYPSRPICPPQYNTVRLARERTYLQLPSCSYHYSSSWVSLRSIC